MALTEEQKRQILLQGGKVNQGGIVSNASQYGLQAGYARKSPTVATPQNPVVSTTIGGLTYDETNPEDYLMKLTARLQTTGKKPTETEYYNAMLANKKLQEIKANPLQTGYEEQQAAYEAARAAEAARDAAILEQFKKEKDIEYQTKIAEAQTQGKKQREAAQGVYSFSGFGRSTKAADTAVEIQNSTNQAINALNAQKEQEIALQQAELAGADPETLQAMAKSLDETRKAVNDWQIESIKKTSEANAIGGADFMESLNNMMKAAGESGLDINKDGFEKVALAYKAMTPDQQKKYLATLDPTEALLLQGLSAATPYQQRTVGSGKSAYKEEYIPGKGRVRTTGAGGGGGGAGGGGGKYTSGFDNDFVSRLNRIALNIIKNPTTSRLGISTGVGATSADWDYIRKNLMLKKFQEARASGVTFGAASEAEWSALQAAASSLKRTADNKYILNELNRIITNYGGKPAFTAPEVKSTGEIVAGGQTTTQEYKAGTTYKSGDRVLKGGKTYQMGTDGKFYLVQ